MMRQGARKRKAALSALVLSWLLGGGMVFAEEPAAEQPAAVEQTAAAEQSAQAAEAERAARGGDTPLGSYNFDEMVITATRTLKDIQEVPSSVSVVTAEDIKARRVSSVAEALQYLPGVFMNPQAQQVGTGALMVRGFSSENLLVLVDGVPMNNPFNNGFDFHSLPVESIERIEVLRGAASSIYGGHAVGGVINITTKEAKEKGVHVDLSSNYSSYATWRNAAQIRLRTDDKWSFGLGYEQRSSHGYPGGGYTTMSSASSKGTAPVQADLVKRGGKYVYGTTIRENDHDNYNFHIQYDFDADRSLKYAFTRAEAEYYNHPVSYVTGADGRPMFTGTVQVADNEIIKLTPGNFYKYDNWYMYDTHVLSYRDEKNQMRASFSFMDQKYQGYTTASVPSDYNGGDWSGKGNAAVYPSKVYNLDFEKAWANLGPHTVVVGANYKKDKITYKSYPVSNWRDPDSQNGDLTRLSKGDTQNLAVFAQDEIKLSPAATAYVGARLDHFTKGKGYFYNVETATSGSNGKSYTEISPKVAFDFKGDEKTNYYISYGHSFNPPQLAYMYRDNPYGEGIAVRANPDLDPEKTDTFEIGMKKQLDQKTDLNLSMYYAKTKDAVSYVNFYQPGTKTSLYKQYVNFAEEKRRGVEFELNHKFAKDFTGYLNYAWQMGKQFSPRMPDTNKTAASESVNWTIPRHLLHAGLAYKHKAFGAVLDGQFVSARQSSNAATGEVGSDDPYFLMNLALSYDIQKDLTVTFSVNNLLNRRFYADAACAGRTYGIGINYSF